MIRIYDEQWIVQNINSRCPNCGVYLVTLSIYNIVILGLKYEQFNKNNNLKQVKIKLF